MSALAELDADMRRAIETGGPLPVEACAIAPAPDMVRAVRMAAKLTQARTAEIFGYSLRSWQHKEESGEGNRALSLGEWNLLLLLADIHPVYLIRPR